MLCPPRLTPQQIDATDTLRDPAGLLRACSNLGACGACIACCHRASGNTYELLGDFKTAAEFHIKGLKLAQEVCHHYARRP